MSLVSYGASSGESSDEEINSELPAPSNKQLKEDATTSNSSRLSTRLSNLLPKPKSTNVTASLINVSNTKGSIKIGVPDLLDSDSDDDTQRRTLPKPENIRPGPSTAKPRSGLFAKLPAPSNSIGGGKKANRALIPHVFSKAKEDKPAAPKPFTGLNSKGEEKDSGVKQSTSGLSIKEIRARSAEKAAKLISEKATKVDEDGDSDEETNVGFFSYVEKVPDAEINPEDLVPELPEPPIVDTFGTTSALDHTAVAENYYDEQSLASNEIDADNAEPIDSVTAEEILRLHGKKRRKEEINIIDINADDALRGNKELLLKSISEEKLLKRSSHSKKNTGGPSGIQKRKHQLTYLVHEAKKRELELKNTWAQNRHSKRQTQMKYGF